jgi:hypothetical protein
MPAAQSKEAVLSWTRRSLLSAFAASAFIACPLCRARAKAGYKVLCASAKTAESDDSQILHTSGDPNLDRILAAEMTAQSAFFNLRPAFVYYSGPDQNAYATTEITVPDTQGTIRYNLGFLKSQLQSTKWGGAVVSGIIAHEFGHIYQFYSAYADALAKLHQTVKFIELHADFISGFYMGRKHAKTPLDLKAYFDEFYSLGDYQFESKDHHGTKEERYFAIKAGYNLALGNSNAGADFAAAQGETFLKEYFR